jgi:hypothetical protein
MTTGVARGTIRIGASSDPHTVANLIRCSAVSSLAIVAVCLVSGACGGASSETRSSAAPPVQSAGSTAPRSAGESAPPERSAGEHPECRSARQEILDEMSRSRERPCGSDAECVTVTNPGSAVHEFDQVVHATDHDELERRSLEHLQRCGTFHVYEPINAVRVVEARCRDGRCQEEETILHIDE